VAAITCVKPKLIITVPLIFEKIYKKKILPVIDKPIVKLLLRIPGINKLILLKIKQSLMASLGGNFREVIIGGAALNAEVEAFFHKIKDYYKNPEATAAAFTDDGWLKIGDSGIMKGRRLFIKGRLKTMLLTANGQNVYPEEIESKLNNLHENLK